LIALIVTLIVLLILAGTTIATLFGENGIIKMAQKAKEETEKAQEEIEKQLQNLANELSNTIGDKIESPNEWTQPDPLKPEITNGKITLKIGDYIDYDCTTSDATYTSPKEKTGHTEDQVFKANEYEYGWRVLGVDEKKQLMLLAEDFAQPTEGGKRLGVRKAYNLKGQEGYENGVDELNNICSIYGNGRGAIEARSINIDDVNRITGYNPNNVGIKDIAQIEKGTKYHKNAIDEYGNDVKYTLLSTGVMYETTNSAGSGTNTNYKQFTYYDEATKSWKSLETNKSVTVKSNHYYYYPTTLTDISDEKANIGIGIESQEYKMLFTNSSTGADGANTGKTDNIIYWLASRCISTGGGRITFGLRLGNRGYINGNTFYDHKNEINSPYYYVRAVVTISPKVQLQDGNTQKDGCKLYKLVVPQD